MKKLFLLLTFLLATNTVNALECTEAVDKKVFYTIKVDEEILEIHINKEKGDFDFETKVLSRRAYTMDRKTNKIYSGKYSLSFEHNFPYEGTFTKLSEKLGNNYVELAKDFFCW